MYLAASKIPPVSQEFIAALRNAFRPKRVTVTTSKEQMVWDAAQQEVIEWCERYAGGSQIIANPDALVKPTPQPWWQRLIFWR